MDPRLRSTMVNGLEVRRFMDADIDRAVADALDKLSPEVRAVSVDVDFGKDDGIRGVISFKDPSGWSVGLIGELKPNRDWSGGLRIRKEWR